MNRSIRFTQTSALNDPFECNPDFSNYEANLRLRMRARVPNEYGLMQRLTQETTWTVLIRDAIEKLRVAIRDSNRFLLSLSEERNNLLMWSHYTASYTGFVIGFDADHPFFSGGQSGYIGQLLKVAYDDHRVKFPRDTNSISDEFMEAILTRKNTCWSYENEWRLFSGRTDIAPEDSVDPEYIHLVEIPVDAVKEIVFGINMDARTKSEIREVLRSDFPHVEITETRLHKTLFDLDIVKSS